MKRCAGFTLVELVMTMVIVGVLGVAVAPRFFDNNVFQSRGFADQVKATLRYAQKAAVAQRRNVCVTVTLPAPSTLTLRIASLSGVAGVCDTDLPLPAGSTNVLTAPAGIAFTALPANFNFDALGRATVTQTINVIGATSSITIDAETGYVR